MRALLTGGAGFIGSHLAAKLLSLGYAVDCVDNLSTGSRANVAHLIENPKFRLFVGNAEEEALIEPLLMDADVIYHLAASVGVKNIMQKTIASIENNIFSTALILRLAEKYKKRIFIFSTSEVYGKSPKFPFAEEDDVVLGPASKLRWSYAASKLVDDFLAISYFSEKKTDVTVVRLFNTIGVGQVGHYGMVVPRFFTQARNNEPITIYGDGSQTRCFTDVRDVTNVLCQLIPVRSSLGEVINIGSNEEISILQLATKIKAQTNSTSSFTYVGFEEAYGPSFEDMARRVPCQDKLKRILGYNFQYRIDDTLDWLLKAPVSKMKKAASLPAAERPGSAAEAL